MALFKPFQVDDLQHLHHPRINFRFGQLDLLPLLIHFWNTQPEGNVFIHVHVGKQRIFLKHGVDGSFMGRDRIHPHAVEINISRGWGLKTTDDSERGRLAAPTGSEQREEFFILDI
ncbi:hypothetical protein SDC9_190646 [bioreactor metagenome]|uniref:Uncharacterized protein n=1 Tax=bioreactor metagenome TaxID=1076179 RepID=A0A645HVS4_9ZZZZ